MSAILRKLVSEGIFGTPPLKWQPSPAYLMYRDLMEREERAWGQLRAALDWASEPPRTTH